MCLHHEVMSRVCPVGSTIVDFAFSIHSEVGFHCQHGRINKKLVPLKTKLNNGDIVEITDIKKLPS